MLFMHAVHRRPLRRCSMSMATTGLSRLRSRSGANRCASLPRIHDSPPYGSPSEQALNVLYVRAHVTYIQALNLAVETNQTVLLGSGILTGAIVCKWRGPMLHHVRAWH